jgi:hypothetical protein
MKKQKKKRITVTLNCGKVTGGAENIKHSRSSRKHPRTNKTYQNKLKKLKSQYKSLFKNSQKAQKEYSEASKEERARINYQRKQKDLFCDRYPDFESFKKNYQLKEVGKVGGTKVVNVDSQRKKELKEQAKRNRGGLLGNY